MPRGGRSMGREKKCRQRLKYRINSVLKKKYRDSIVYRIHGYIEYV